MTRYYDYMHLDKLLSCQIPKTEAHHEFFFIIIHQVYELWFSSILHELDSVMKSFSDGEVETISDGVSKPRGIDEQEIAVMVSKLNRIIEIFKLLVAQIRVMETLTPLDFLDFRDQLLPASGYDSLQFRMIEVKLGLRLVDGRTDVFKRQGFPNKDKFTGNAFAEAQLEELSDANQKRSLFDYLESWLERTPFVQSDGLGSWFEPEIKKISKPEEASSDRDAIEAMQEIFDVEKYESFVKEFQDRKRMSHAAFLAALFIHLYRDKPILQQPHRLLEALKEVDELFTVWRHWHSSMVMRMIGQKPGTAGYEKTVTQTEQTDAADITYGYKYLEGTRAYRFFPELARVSTYMIPRRYLPNIPPNVALEMERLLFSDRT